MPQPKKEEAKVEDVKTITLPERLTIKELADKMKLQPSVIVKKLFLNGTDGYLKPGDRLRSGRRDRNGI